MTACLTPGIWLPTNSTSQLHPRQCTAAELFAAGLRYPLACSPRCSWQPARAQLEYPCSASMRRWQRMTPQNSERCLQDKWLLFVGDSNVRNLLRYVARWLGVASQLPESMQAPGGSASSNSSGGGGGGGGAGDHIYDDWDVEVHRALKLSFRFSGPDPTKYERVWREPATLEAFDIQQQRHHPRSPSSRVLSSAHAHVKHVHAHTADGDGARRSVSPRQRAPDMIFFGSSLWSPTCASSGRIATAFTEAITSAEVPVVAWCLLGS